jgi:PKD repeat protein
MRFGPHGDTQALYYTTFAGGGEVRRISYTGGANRAPSAAIDAEPTYGPAPLKITFDGSGSRDPDGNALTYVWDFGDGKRAETAAPRTTHTLTTNGVYTATLRVGDGLNTSAPAAIRIDVGNSPPNVEITSPGADFRYAVGQQMTLQANATNAENDAMTLTWSALIHHADHTHPLLQPTEGASVTFTAPPLEDLEATTNSYLEVKLVAGDSKGATRELTRTLEPHKVPITFVTEPAGLKLEVNGRQVTTPLTLTSWEGYTLNVIAAPQVGPDGKPLYFNRWADEGSANRIIITPSDEARYTAIFSNTPAASGSNRVLLPFVARDQ